MPVEALFPLGGGCLDLASSSGWSRVSEVDAVGGSPHCDFANEGGGVASGCSPGWRSVTLEDVTLDLVGEVGDKLGSPCQVASPDGIGLERCWNARQPGQRTRVGWRERCEAPVEHGRHIVCCSKVASRGGRQEVAERVFTGFGREGEQVGSEGWPGGFAGESSDVVIG
jgi:hypothetical protein